MAKKVSYCQAKFRLYFAYIIILSRKFVLIFRLYYHFVKKNGAYISLIFAYTPLIFRLYPAYTSLIFRLYFAYTTKIVKKKAPFLTPCSNTVHKEIFVTYVNRSLV